MGARRLLVAVVAAIALTGSCSRVGRASGASPDELAAQGGAATVEVAGSTAFAQPVPGLTGDQRRTFAVGDNFFNDNWVTAPASTDGRDGLGPLFNAQSCSSCHFRDGRGQPPADADDPQRGLLIRISTRAGDGTLQPHPVLGGQLQDRSIRGVPIEGTVVITNVEHPTAYADGTPYTLVEPRYQLLNGDGRPLGDDVLLSPRVAPAVFGVGLLEGVPADEIVEHADPDDADGDGVSGRASFVTDPDTGRRVLGRFGWKAAVPTVRDQNAGAFAGDIGITSTVHPEQPCTSGQTACLAAPAGGEPEVDDAKLEQVTFYTRTLAVPARRAADKPDTTEGQELFGSLGCAACHLPELRTGPSELAALDRQVIRPYTDLLLHDMGRALADDRPDGDASGTEWRTPPLWGIGLVETVNGHTRFLHDGRARSIEEAVLWHGGEARSAQRAFTELPARSRRMLLAFLGSL